MKRKPIIIWKSRRVTRQPTTSHSQRKVMVFVSRIKFSDFTEIFLFGFTLRTNENGPKLIPKSSEVGQLL